MENTSLYKNGMADDGPDWAMGMASDEGGSGYHL